jgi:hypothetical protein
VNYVQAQHTCSICSMQTECVLSSDLCGLG